MHLDTVLLYTMELGTGSNWYLRDNVRNYAEITFLRAKSNSSVEFFDSTADVDTPV